MSPFAKSYAVTTASIVTAAGCGYLLYRYVRLTRLQRKVCVSLEAAMNESNFEVLKSIRRCAPCGTSSYGWRVYETAGERDLSALAQIAEAGDLTWQVWQRLILEDEDVFLPFARVRPTRSYTTEIRERCIALANSYFVMMYTGRHGLPASACRAMLLEQREGCVAALVRERLKAI